MGGGDPGVPRGRGRGGRGRGRGRGFNNGGGYGQPGDDSTQLMLVLFQDVGTEHVFLSQVALDLTVTGTAPTLATVSISIRPGLAVMSAVGRRSPGNAIFLFLFCGGRVKLQLAATSSHFTFLCLKPQD